MTEAGEHRCSAHLEDRRIAVCVDERGIPTFTDRTTGIGWSPFESAQAATVTLVDVDGQKVVADLPKSCCVRVTQVDARRIEVLYEGLCVLERRVGFKLQIALELGQPEGSVVLTIAALELGAGLVLEALTYPCHQFALRTTVDDGYLVVPTKQGVIVPTRFEVGYMRFQHNTWAKIADLEQTLPFDTGSLNMPWFGAVQRNGQRQSAILAHVETPSDAAITVVCNKVVPTPALEKPGVETSKGMRLSTIAPVWRGCHGQLGYARQLRIQVLPDGDYVALAKRYREIAVSTGRYRSLKDKIRENPNVGRIVGAPDIKIYVYTNRLNEPYYRAGSEPVLSGYSAVHTTFDQVAEIARDMHDNLGMDRALVLLGGWIRAGYDREHPDVWPPAEVAGGVVGLRRASEEATRLGYLFALHDNYQDMYPDAPSYDAGVVMRKMDGTLHHGHVWDGGPCDLICSAKAIPLAKPVVDQVGANTSVNGYYLDTTTAASLYECFSGEHPITRQQDQEYKLELLRWLCEQGFAVGGEAGTDWAIRACTFFEGIPGTARGFFDGVTGPSFGISTPLFSLVYHDAVVCYWQHGQPFGREDQDNHFLHDLLAGFPSSWVLVAEQWNDLKPLIKEAFDVLGELHRRTAHLPLVAHRFLSPDYALQETRFEGGLRVVANFGIVSALVEGYTIAPKGFLIDDPQDGIVQGKMQRHCVITSGRLQRRRP